MINDQALSPSAASLCFSVAVWGTTGSASLQIQQNDSFFLWNEEGGSIICSHKHVTGVIFTLQVIYICKESDDQGRQVKGIMIHLGDTLHSVFASRSRSLKFCSVIKKKCKKGRSIISCSALFNQADLLLCVWLICPLWPHMDYN